MTRIVFAAVDPTGGCEPWVTDGTTAGTSRRADINHGSDGSSPGGFTALPDGRVLSGASDGRTGYPL